MNDLVDPCHAPGSINHNIADVVNISIIFLCHNNPHIKLCVDASFEMMIPGDEIIVVDDNSHHETLEILSGLRDECKIRILHSKKCGNRSHNRNIGARAAVNNILLFMDGDMVLCPYALQALRTAHMKGEAIAYVGPKHNIQHSDVHSAFFSGISNKRYIELLQTENGRIQLMSNPLFSDNSVDCFKQPEMSPYFWLYYYTGASSVEKDVFESVGGFDESFTSWGGEDTDFGYRISKKGLIGFLNQFQSIHIPHQKDVIAQEISSSQNILKMLKKYNSWEFEVLHAFNSSLDVLRNFHNVINQMRMLSPCTFKKMSAMIGSGYAESKTIDASMCCTLSPNTAAAYPVSSGFPNGMFVYNNYDGEHLHKESLCLTLDFPDEKFNIVYVIDTIFIYPTAITSRILQELGRVSKRLLIVPTEDTTRIDWHGVSISQSSSRLSYRSNDIMDFSFTRTTDGFVEVAPVIEMK